MFLFACVCVGVFPESYSKNMTNILFVILCQEKREQAGLGMIGSDVKELTGVRWTTLRNLMEGFDTKCFMALRAVKLSFQHSSVMASPFQILILSLSIFHSLTYLHIQNMK